MKFFLVILMASISLSASAQWYRLDLKLKKKQVERSPFIAQVSATHRSLAAMPSMPIVYPSITMVELSRSKYSLEAAEHTVMRSAQHNMSLGGYTGASYNFSDLARIYIRQKRFAEAKWFLLVSNNISRRQRDDKLTVSNLIDLAVIKASIGDCNLAEKDLAEAYTIASAHGYDNDLLEIKKRMEDIKQDQIPFIKYDGRYAE
jgi:hypothetical protein